MTFELEFSIDQEYWDPKCTTDLELEKPDEDVCVAECDTCVKPTIPLFASEQCLDCPPTSPFTRLPGRLAFALDGEITGASGSSGMTQNYVSPYLGGRSFNLRDLTSLLGNPRSSGVMVNPWVEHADFVEERLAVTTPGLGWVENGFYGVGCQWVLDDTHWAVTGVVDEAGDHVISETGTWQNPYDGLLAYGFLFGTGWVGINAGETAYPSGCPADPLKTYYPFADGQHITGTTYQYKDTIDMHVPTAPVGLAFELQTFTPPDIARDFYATFDTHGEQVPWSRGRYPLGEPHDHWTDFVKRDGEIFGYSPPGWFDRDNWATGATIFGFTDVYQPSPAGAAQQQYETTVRRVGYCWHFNSGTGVLSLLGGNVPNITEITIVRNGIRDQSVNYNIFAPYGFPTEATIEETQKCNYNIPPNPYSGTVEETHLKLSFQSYATGSFAFNAEDTYSQLAVENTSFPGHPDYWPSGSAFQAALNPSVNVVITGYGKVYDTKTGGAFYNAVPDSQPVVIGGEGQDMVVLAQWRTSINCSASACGSWDLDRIYQWIGDNDPDNYNSVFPTVFPETGKIWFAR